MPNRESDTFDDDLAWELERLRAVGINTVVAIDLSRPEFQVPVVRVVIPGLEGASMHANYMPGPRAHAMQPAAV